MKETTTKTTKEVTAEPIAPVEPVAEQPAFTRSSKAPLVISLIAAGVVLLLGLGALGISALFVAHRREAVAPLAQPGLGRSGELPGRFYGGRGRIVAGSVVRGVVTAVSSDGFTLAGGGTTKTIKISSSTTYTGDKTSVAVNDSVTVEYTGSGDSLTATAVRIMNTNE